MNIKYNQKLEKITFISSLLLLALCNSFALAQEITKVNGLEDITPPFLNAKVKESALEKTIKEAIAPYERPLNSFVPYIESQKAKQVNGQDLGNHFIELISAYLSLFGAIKSTEGKNQKEIIDFVKAIDQAIKSIDNKEIETLQKRDCSHEAKHKIISSWFFGKIKNSFIEFYGKNIKRSSDQISHNAFNHFYLSFANLIFNKKELKSQDKLNIINLFIYFIGKIDKIEVTSIFNYFARDLSKPEVIIEFLHNISINSKENFENVIDIDLIFDYYLEKLSLKSCKKLFDLLINDLNLYKNTVFVKNNNKNKQILKYLSKIIKCDTNIDKSNLEKLALFDLKHITNLPQDKSLTGLHIWPPLNPDNEITLNNDILFVFNTNDFTDDQNIMIGKFERLNQGEKTKLSKTSSFFPTLMSDKNKLLAFLNNVYTNKHIIRETKVNNSNTIEQEIIGFDTIKDSKNKIYALMCVKSNPDLCIIHKITTCYPLSAFENFPIFYNKTDEYTVIATDEDKVRAAKLKDLVIKDIIRQCNHKTDLLSLSKIQSISNKEAITCCFDLNVEDIKIIEEDIKNEEISQTHKLLKAKNSGWSVNKIKQTTKFIQKYFNSIDKLLVTYFIHKNQKELDKVLSILTRCRLITTDKISDKVPEKYGFIKKLAESIIFLHVTEQELNQAWAIS